MSMKKLVLSWNIGNRATFLQTERSIFFGNDTCAEIMIKPFEMLTFYQRLYTYLYSNMCRNFPVICKPSLVFTDWQKITFSLWLCESNFSGRLEALFSGKRWLHMLITKHKISQLLHVGHVLEPPWTFHRKQVSDYNEQNTTIRYAGLSVFVNKAVNSW